MVLPSNYPFIAIISDQNYTEVTKDYDARGRLVSVTNGDGEVNKFKYDVFDRMVKFIDSKNSQLAEASQKYTEYHRDVFGRVIAEIDPAGNTTYYDYTGDNTSSCSSCSSGSNAGLVSHIERPQTGTTDKEHLFYKYDLSGKVTHIDYASTNTPPTDWTTAEVIFTYTDLGAVKTIKDNRLTLAGDKTYHYDYETGTGRLEKITHPDGYTQEFFYDTSNDHVAYRDVDGNVMKYDYDTYGRLDTLTDPFGVDTVWGYYDNTQTSHPIGAIQKVERSNYTFDEYFYDSLGRLDRINYRMSEYTQATLNYVDLEYDDAGMITGKDMGGTYNVEYDYDDAYRLTDEIYNNSSDVEQFRRSYTYDDAGNRATMAFDGATSTTTTYAYGDRNEMTSNTGYTRFGSVDTGPMTFQYDDRGNMKYQSGITNTWNEDDRLTQVNISGGDPKGGAHEVNYRYDNGGRRILKDVDDGQRTRYFFKNLIEETKKVSIGTHSDTAFGFTSKLDAEGSDGGVNGFNTPANVSISDDADRYSNVYTVGNWTSHGDGYWGSTDGWNLTGKRTASFWAKTATTSSEISIHVKCTDGTRIGLYYKVSSGTDYKDSINPAAFFYLGSAQNYLNKWNRVERDLQADIDAFWTGKTLDKITGCTAWDVLFDDLRFSNSMTVEQNILGPGNIGHILRNCIYSTTTHARTDNWYHYDQVGSIVCKSSASMIPSLSHVYSDSFGNRMSSWQTGEWTSTWASRDGWGHNTKAVDGDTGNLYMYQRWYQPELGIFMSQAPTFAFIEHPYTFASSSPNIWTDVLGTCDGGSLKKCLAKAYDRRRSTQDDALDDLNRELAVIATTLVAEMALCHGAAAATAGKTKSKKAAAAVYSACAIAALAHNAASVLDANWTYNSVVNHAERDYRLDVKYCHWDCCDDCPHGY